MKTIKIMNEMLKYITEFSSNEYIDDKSQISINDVEENIRMLVAYEIGMKRAQAQKIYPTFF